LVRAEEMIVIRRIEP